MKRATITLALFLAIGCGPAKKWAPSIGHPCQDLLRNNRGCLAVRTATRELVYSTYQTARQAGFSQEEACLICHVRLAQVQRDCTKLEDLHKWENIPLIRFFYPKSF